MEIYTGTSETREGQLLRDWFIKESGSNDVGKDFSYICWTNGPNIKAVALFDYYNGASLEWHFYGKKYLTRGVLKYIHEYVFVHLKCTTMIVRPPRHVDLRKYLPRLGFKYLAVIPRFYGPNKRDDAVLYYTDATMFATKQLAARER
jgi:hypothetical protein